MPKRAAASAARASVSKAAKCDESMSVSKFGLTWQGVGGHLKQDIPNIFLLSSDNFKGNEKIAGFDMDWCIIKPASGGKWPKNASDWTWLFEGATIPAKMSLLHEDGYKIFFITNQAGIEKGNTKAADIQKKMELVIEALDFPIMGMIVTGQSHFRKPSTSAWDLLVKNHNQGVKVDLSKCLFVGDAAGRQANYLPGRKKDFSCSDRMFASNIGIEFKTPEEFFLDEKPAPFSWGSPDPKVILNNSEKKKNELKDSYHTQKQEIVIVCGPPASGKSTFCKRFLENHGYVRVNRDTLGTPAKCVKVAQEAIDEGKSVVVDNTNPTVADRGQYLDLAKTANIPCRCFYMKTDFEVAQHLNYVRVAETGGGTRRIPMVAYNVYRGKFKEPHTQEGFSEVVNIPFVAHFPSEKFKKIFMLWTTAGH